LAELIHPDDHAVTVAHFNQLAADTAGSIFENEYRMKHSNGEWRWLRSRDVVFSRNAAGLPEQLLGMAEDITERKRVEAEKERLFQEVSQQREQLRALTRQLTEAQEVERKELARELHDRVGQKLTALGLNLNLIWAQLTETASRAGLIQARLDDSLSLVAEMTEHIRDVMANLRPPVLDDYGLVAALHWYGSQLAPRVGFTITVQGEEPEPRLVTPVENVLFRIAQEALTNVAKHAQASQVMVTVRADNETVRLIIVDDGIGFEPACQAECVERQGWGLITMMERAEAVGGHCHIKSRPGQGTQVIVEVAR
jgi:two-component system sensor histidine kinase UhpB